MDRKQLIKTLIPALVKSTSSSPTDVENVLNTYEIEELKKELARQRKLGYLQTPTDTANDEAILRQIEAIRAEARSKFERDNARTIAAQQAESEAFYRDYYLGQSFKIAFRGKRPIRNAASENIVIGWLNPGETLSAAWLLKLLTEQPELADQLQWRPAAPNQDELDRVTFENCAKYRYAANDANFDLLKSALGSGFTQRDIENVIAMNQVSLASPTQSEIDQWKAEDREQRKDFLINHATPEQLRAAAREESADRRALEEQQRINDAYKTAKQRDSATGFPPLPPELTREQIRNAPVERLRFWIKKFGNANVNARLQGR